MRSLVLILASSATLAVKAESAHLSSSDDLTSHVRASFLSKTNGSTQLFSTSVNGRDFVRNPRFWLRGMNGLLATHVGYGPGATAITPWHVLEANHHKNDVGSKLYFCDQTSHTVVRTVVAGTEIRPDIKSDIWLAVLDEALPGWITPMPLMPANWTNHVLSARLPVAAMNQAGCFGAATLLSLRQAVPGGFRYGYAYGPSDIAPTVAFAPLHGGDSGHPIVTLVGTNLVLLGHLTFETGGRIFLGPDYSLYAPDIQGAIRSVGSNATAKAQCIMTIDLERFQ